MNTWVMSPMNALKIPIPEMDINKNRFAVNMAKPH